MRMATTMPATPTTCRRPLPAAPCQRPIHASTEECMHGYSGYRVATPSAFSLMCGAALQGADDAEWSVRRAS